uniref:Uncharacterized protein n=1 Tax=Anguilla anguilla TaxID=7936 RepID=A0A0E9R2G9_ANGAN
MAMDSEGNIASTGRQVLRSSAMLWRTTFSLSINQSSNSSEFFIH